MKASVSTILIFIYFWSGCGSLQQDSMHLSYVISVADTTTREFDIELKIDNAPSGIIEFSFYTFKEYVSLELREAFHENGTKLEIRNIEEQIAWNGHPFTRISKILQNPQGGKISIHYRVQVGKLYAPHGQHPLYFYGYMDGRFAQVSGKNLFLLPAEFNSIRVQFSIPEGWGVSIPWKYNQGWYSPTIESTYLRSEVTNTTIVLGFLEHQVKKIGDSDVYVYLFKDWASEFKDQVYQTAFTAYQEVMNLFGDEGEGIYVFNFMPNTSAKLPIRAYSWSSSQGSETTPNNEYQWLVCIRKLIDKWIKYPPYGMVYKSQEDFWVLDGIKKYYAIQIAEKVCGLDAQKYLEEGRDNFYKKVAMQARRGYSEFHSLVDPLNSVKQLSKNKASRVRPVSLTIIELIDDKINSLSQGQLSLSDVLKYQYKKKHNLVFLDDIKEVVGKKITEQIEYYLENLDQIPQKKGWIQPADSLLSNEIQEIHSVRLDTLRLILTGTTHGFLEHCGCKVNQNGGEARRATVISNIRKKFKDLTLISVGSLFPWKFAKYNLTTLEIEEFKVYIDAMNKMGYALSTIGFEELYYGRDLFKNMASRATFPFIAANILENRNLLVDPYTIIQQRERKIGFIGITQITHMDEAEQNLVLHSRLSGLTFLDPIKTLKHYVPRLQEEVDLIFVIGAIEPSMINRIKQEIEGIDAIISTNKYDPRIMLLENSLTYTTDVSTGFMGKSVVVFSGGGQYFVDQFDFYLNQVPKVVGLERYITPLSDKIPDDPEIRLIIDNLYSNVIDEQVDPILGWNKKFSESNYVSVDACKVCHEEQFIQWKHTKHATAMNTLLDARRHYQPKCVVCHVTGLGYKTGYEMGNLRHPLLNVQCEMCHGPGEKHIKNPLNVEMIRTPSEKICTSCHDAEHSDFDFALYFSQVRH